MCYHHRIMIFPSTQDMHVIVVGDLMLDRYWFGSIQRVSQEAPVPVINVAREKDSPGGAANVALNIASLGVKCTLIGIVGSDENATKLKIALRKAGVISDLVVCEDYPTTVKLRALSHNQQVLRADFEARHHDEERLSRRVLEKVTQNLSTANVLIIQDYDKGAISSPGDIISVAKDAGVPVVVDPKQKPFSRYSGADIIKPNAYEFEMATGGNLSDKDFLETAKEICFRNKFEFLAVTQGAKGSVIVSKNGEYQCFEALPVDVFDVTGAGDTTVAVLAIGIAAGWEVPEAMEAATIAGSLVVSKIGTAVVDELELANAFFGKIGKRRSLFNKDSLKKVVELSRKEGKKIVFTNGCFDIIHAGHVRYLEEARALGDLLIVALNDDESVARLKGPERPINVLEHRAEVLFGLEAVDCVVGFSEDGPEDLLHLVRPDILVKGGDYKPEDVVGAEIVMEAGGQVRILALIEGLSTSQIAKKLSSESFEGK